MGYVQSIRQKIGHDPLLLVGAGVWVYRDGKVLLQQRADNGMWGSHGGAVELGERVEDAARRELYEETGLTAGEMTLLGVFSGEDLCYTYPNGDVVSIVSVEYVCDDFSGEVRALDGEAQRLAWFDIDALPEAISPPVRPALAAFVTHWHSQQ